MLKNAVLTAVFCLGVVASLAAQNDGRTTMAVFPMFATGHFTDGTYYRMTIMSSNPSVTVETSCTTTAWVNGRSASAPSKYLASQWNIEPSDGSGALITGYITMSCSEPINAFLLYSYYSKAGQKLAEATVFPSVTATVVQVLADQTEGARLGIAIVNDKAFPQDATIRLIDSTGTLVASSKVTLAAHQSLPRFLDELTNRRLERGQILISCDSGCGAIGLRYTGAVFTTIPASVRIP